MLRITEIFHSLQGESTKVGLPTVFIRLTGCPLRCQYCDTAYAFKGGQKQSIATILETVHPFQTKHICVTGGEPLAQPDCLILLSQLADCGYDVSIETSGALDISPIDKRIKIIMDIKTPDSQESHQNRYENIAHLKSTDEIKFVICSQGDYDWTKQCIVEHKLLEKCAILLSPSFHDISPDNLANLILKDKLPVRFQLQLHKILWNDARGR
jgi:7-carboxy-7-deazaguanine synthase